MNNFKRNQRIVVYDVSYCIIGNKGIEYSTHRTPGHVVEFKGDVIEFEPDVATSNGNWFVHSKSCRKLKAKGYWKI